MSKKETAPLPEHPFEAAFQMEAPEPVKPPEPAPKPKRKEKPPIPLFLEVSLTAAKVIVSVVGLTTALLSILSGASFLLAVLKAAGAIVSTGLLLWCVNYIVATKALELALEDYKQKLDQQEKDPFSTRDFRA